MKNLLLLLTLLICGTTFSQLWKSMVGSLQFGLADEQEYAILDNNRPVVAINKTGGNTVEVFLWDGQTWQNLTQIVPDPITDLQVSNDGNTPIVGFFNTNVGKYQVWSWDGTNWNILGDTGLSVYHPNSVRMIASANSGEYYISYVSDISKEANMQKWNGSSWPSFGNNFDPFINDLQFLHPGSDGSKLWALSEDFGSGGELRLWNSPEATQSWSWYSNAPAENENIMADMTVQAGHPPMISLVKSSTPGTVNTIRANGGPGFNPVPQDIVIAGGIDEISTALNNADVEHVFIRETGSTEGKLFEFSTGSWASVGGPVHTNGMDSRLALHVPSGKPYVLYNKDGEATLKAFNTKPSYSSDSGIQSVCQDATGASVFSNITFNDTDYDSLFISAVSNTPSVLTSANITVTRTNPYSPSSAINDFKIDVTPQPGIAGTASVDLFIIDGIDTLTYPIFVVVNPLPTVNAGVDQVVCQGSPVTLSGSGASFYSWDNSVIDGSPFTPGVGTLSYTVTGTDGNGCQNTDIAVVTVNASPAFSYGHDNVFCNGANDGSLNLNGLPVSQTFDIYYDLGSTVGPISLSSDTFGDLIIPSLGPGSYTNISVTDANGCSYSVPGPEVITEPSVLSSSPVADQFICDGSSATLSGSAVGGTPGYTYTWDNGVTDATPFSPTVGTVTYNLTITDANGCTALDNADITVYALPTISAGPDQNVCEGTNAVFSGSGGVSYSWNNGIVDGAPFTMSAGSLTGTVTGTDANGCQNTDVSTIFFNFIPTFTLSHTDVTCNGLSDGMLNLTGLLGFQNYDVYYDLGSNVGPINLTANASGLLDVPSLPAGSYTNVNVISPFGCSYSVSGPEIISEPTLLTSTPITDQFICDGTSTTLAGSATGGISPYVYAWDNGVVDNVSFTPSVGSVTYNLTITDANGCSALDNTDITVYALPAVDAGIDQTACENDMVTLNGTGATSYLWDNGVSDGVPFTATAGVTVYTVTGTDGNGCQNTDNLTLTVNSLPTVFAGSDQIVCENNNVILSGSGASTYIWDNGVTDGVSFNQAPGLITYTVTGTDINGCQNTDAVDVTANPAPPIFTLSSTSPSICGGSNGTLIISGLAFSTTYDVSYDNPSTQGPFTLTSDPSGNIVISGLSAGAYSNITVTGTNTCSTVAGASEIISDPSAPAILAGIDQTICEGQSIVLTATNPDNALISWDNFVTDGVPTTPTSTTTYTVTANSSGCVSTDQLTVTVNPLPTIGVSTTDEACGANDGSATATITNGLPPYSIYWSNGSTTTTASNLSGLFYYVNVSDANNCYAMAVAPISSSAISLSGVVVDNTCNGDSNGSIDLSVSGTGPFKYYWSNGPQVEDISGLTAGQYEVYVEDVNGCSATASFVITEPSEIISNYTTTAATCGNADGSIVAAIIGGTTPYSFQWLDNTQTIIPGATLSTLSGTLADIYYLNITDANGCISQMTTALSEIGGPIVTADSLGASTCANDGFINIDVNTSNTIVSTIWTSGQTTEDLTNIGDGNYSVTVLDNNGCKGLANFNVGQVKPIATPICIVTVDTNTNTNKIVWEKPISTNISEFRIYRESSIAGSFQFVDAVSYSSLSEYNDTIAYSSLRSWRYVLTTVDSCGVESLKSEDHKTIHYTSTDDGLGNYELFWDEYEGFTYPTYFIWRFTDVNGWEEIHTEPYGGTLSYIDAPPSIVDLNYVVIIEPASTCTSTLKATDYNSSRSNKNYSNFFPDDDDSGIELNELAFEVYPNPSTGQFIVNTSGINVYTIDIIDLRGRTILSYNDVKGNQKIDLSDFESGTYLIKLTSLEGTGNQKIIKQ